MFQVFGTLFHIALSLAMRLFLRSHAGALGAILAAKELGELKGSVSGPVLTWEKHTEMFRKLFTKPTIVPQWRLPTLVVWTIDRSVENEGGQIRKIRTFREKNADAGNFSYIPGGSSHAWNTKTLCVPCNIQ